MGDLQERRDGQAGERLERDLERLARYRVLDDTFMRQVFKGQTQLTEHVLRIVTGIEGLEVVETETQRDLKRLAGSRSVALDVWATDAAGTQYDLEVQAGGSLDPLRFRYYGSAMDVERLSAGCAYSELPERWVVVVLERDPEGPGRRDRHYRMREGDAATLEDGAHLLYVNAAWRGGDDLGSLMADFCERDPSAIRDGMLRERVQWLKTSEEGVREMCAISDEIREEGRAEGLAESIRSLMETLKLSAEQAMDALRVPAADRPRYLAML